MSLAAAFKARLRGGLKAAMQARRGDEVRLLRALIAVLDNAEAVPVEGMHDFSRSGASDAPAGEVARRALTEAKIAEVLQGEVESRLEAAALYREGGNPRGAQHLEAEVALIRLYLG